MSTPLKTWLTLLGKTTLDSDIQNALAKAGCKAKLSIRGGHTSVSEEFDGMMVEFRAAALVPGFESEKKGVGVLESISMWLADEDELYEGPLPHDISPQDTRTKLCERFGTRFYEDDEMDQWYVEGAVLRAEYAEDGSLISVHVILRTES